MKIKRFLLFAYLLWSTGALAQVYPSKPVRLVVPYAAGGPADLLAREVARGLSEALGQPFIIEPKAGGGSMIGTEAVVRASPDGHTFLVSTAASHIVSPAMEKSPRYDGLKDLAPVAMFANVPNVISANLSVPAGNVKELIAYAKANPGKLSYGSAGNGSSPHLAGEMFKLMAGVDLVHVPYKGAQPAVIDLLGGAIQLGFVNISAVLPHIRSGKMKAYAVTSLQRSGALPELPTADEGGLSGYEVTSWYGLAAPIGTPRAVIDTLHAAIRKVMSDPAMKKRLLETQGAEPYLMSPEEFAAFLRKDHDRLVKLIRAAGLRPG
jgi:tripartite-type tricarboxylate transporter receptor subunit TctC